METTCYPGRHESFRYPLSQIVLPSTPSQIFAYPPRAQSKHMLCDGKCGELKGQVGPDGSYLRLLRKLVVITATSLFIILERSLWIEKGCATVKRQILHSPSQKGKEKGPRTLINKTKLTSLHRFAQETMLDSLIKRMWLRTVSSMVKPKQDYPTLWYAAHFPKKRNATVNQD